MTFLLADRCPRLATARDQHNDLHARRILTRARLRRRWAKLYALVGHREVQLHRAVSTGDARYIDRRERKLAWARDQLGRIDAELERVA